ncbi:unnamed protein product, partial [Closterium sp. NIES-54]
MSIAHTLSGVVATSAAASGISFFGFKRNAGRIQFSKQHVSRISRRFHLLPCALGSERPAVETIPREEEGLGTGEPGGGTNEGDLSSGSNPATLGAASTGAAASKAATSYIAASPFSPQASADPDSAAAATLEGEFAEVDRMVAVNLGWKEKYPFPLLLPTPLPLSAPPGSSSIGGRIRGGGQAGGGEPGMGRKVSIFLSSYPHRPFSLRWRQRQLPWKANSR